MRVATILIALVGGLFLAGCAGGEKNPQEAEAAKYPQVKPLSPAEKAELDAKLAAQSGPPPGKDPTQNK